MPSAAETRSRLPVRPQAGQMCSRSRRYLRTAAPQRQCCDIAVVNVDARSSRPPAEAHSFSSALRSRPGVVWDRRLPHSRNQARMSQSSMVRLEPWIPMRWRASSIARALLAWAARAALAWILEQRIDPWLVAGRHAPPHRHPVPGSGSGAVKPTAAWAGSLNTRASWRRWRGRRSSLPWPAGSDARGPGGEARTERRSHDLDHRPFVYSEITPTLRPQQRPTGLGAKGLMLPQLAMPGSAMAVRESALPARQAAGRGLPDPLGESAN